MNNNGSDARMLTRTLFRLLPIQVLLAAVGAVNGIVSSYFAANFVGIDAMSAVGLYSPLNMLLQAIGTMLLGGSVILCGKYMGQNRQDRLQNAFSLDLLLSLLISGVFTALFVLLSLLDATSFLTKDAAVRPIFNRYLLGQAIGVLPMVLGNQLAAFLSLENKGGRTIAATVAYIVVNLLLNYLFVQVLSMEAFGLALASSLGLWVFFGVQAQHFLTGRSHFHAAFTGLDWKESGELIKTGLPGAVGSGYQTGRGLILNWLMSAFVGSVGISAFATANNLLGIIWSIPTGMLAVSRMMISVSVGEEDRQTLTDVMRVMLFRFVPLMCAVAFGIMLCAQPLTRIFYRDPTEPVYWMTVWGLRLLPLCMPLAVICAHFVCYGQVSGKQGLVHLISLLDGIVCVCAFAALLIRSLGMNAVYAANVINGAVMPLVLVAYAWIKGKRFPRSMDELMVVPPDFGVSEDERLDLTVRSIEEVVDVSRQIQQFCLERGVDPRRALLAGLSMEEMAGNIVEHGFGKDGRKHAVDVRVVHKNDDVILRIKDDCVPFDPSERQKLAEGEDVTKNIGIRMVFGIAEEVRYQNILGLNVLTIWI